jgi:hypothetical protein
MCVMVYLVLEFSYIVFITLSKFSAPEIDIAMDILVFCLINLFLLMWEEMVTVFIKKKFTRVRFNDSIKGIKNDLISRIENLAGKNQN